LTADFLGLYGTFPDRQKCLQQPRPISESISLSISRSISQSHLYGAKIRKWICHKSRIKSNWFP